MLGGSLLPPGGRAGTWNTYVATVLPHLDGFLRACLGKGMAAAFGACGWAPPRARSALGVVHGVRG
eukprot:6204566-Alexandrium_andersonii.AAC.1